MDSQHVRNNLLVFVCMCTCVRMYIFDSDNECGATIVEKKMESDMYSLPVYLMSRIVPCRVVSYGVHIRGCCSETREPRVWITGKKIWTDGSPIFNSYFFLCRLVENVKIGARIVRRPLSIQLFRIHWSHPLLFIIICFFDLNEHVQSDQHTHSLIHSYTGFAITHLSWVVHRRLRSMYLHFVSQLM